MSFPFSRPSGALRPHWLTACAIGALALSGSPRGAAQPPDRLATPRALLSHQETRRQQVAHELSGMGQRDSDAQGDLFAHSRALYRLSRGGLLPLSGGLESLLTHAANLERLKRVVKKDLARVKQLRSRHAELRRETALLSRQIDHTTTYLNETERLRRQRATELRAASEFEQAFTTSRIGGGHTLRSAQGSLSVLEDELVGGFEQERGRLALPISGPSQVREASRAESGGTGLELLARAGSAVRACAAGRVAFSDRYASYGRLVIMDHGHRYYTVYAGLGEVQVRVGDDLSRSARVGTAGVDGVLYFEVRKGTRTLSPRAWLGL